MRRNFLPYAASAIAGGIVITLLYWVMGAFGGGTVTTAASTSTPAPTVTVYVPQTPTATTSNATATATSPDGTTPTTPANPASTTCGPEPTPALPSPGDLYNNGGRWSPIGGNTDKSTKNAQYVTGPVIAAVARANTSSSAAPIQTDRTYAASQLRSCWFGQALDGPLLREWHQDKPTPGVANRTGDVTIWTTATGAQTDAQDKAVLLTITYQKENVTVYFSTAGLMDKWHTTPSRNLYDAAKALAMYTRPGVPTSTAGFELWPYGDTYYVVVSG